MIQESLRGSFTASSLPLPAGDPRVLCLRHLRGTQTPERALASPPAPQSPCAEKIPDQLRGGGLPHSAARARLPRAKRELRTPRPSAPALPGSERARPAPELPRPLTPAPSPCPALTRGGSGGPSSLVAPTPSSPSSFLLARSAPGPAPPTGARVPRARSAPPAPSPPGEGRGEGKPRGRGPRPCAPPPERARRRPARRPPAPRLPAFPSSW